MKIRTMRDIPTIQGLRGQATPTTREQAVTEVARLEHELSRLKREWEMWTTNQNKTVERIRRVEQRLALLKELVDPAEGETPEQQQGRAQGARAQTKEADSGKNWKIVDLQY